MKKTVVYSGSRNLYPDMETAAKSLISNSKVDDVVFLIEDPEFPVSLPDICRTVDVSSQSWFPEDGPNMRTKFSYMALVRACYADIFPDLDEVLQLDVDTIVLDDVACLWDVESGYSPFSAVEEKYTSYEDCGRPYFNIGVAMFHLGQIRAKGYSEKVVDLLNTRELKYVDQDAWNLVGAREATSLNCRWNETPFTGFTDDPGIVHYAGYSRWQKSAKVPRREYIRKYREMTWEEVLENHDKIHVR